MYIKPSNYNLEIGDKLYYTCLTDEYTDEKISMLSRSFDEDGTFYLSRLDYMESNGEKLFIKPLIVNGELINNYIVQTVKDWYEVHPGVKMYLKYFSQTTLFVKTLKSMANKKKPKGMKSLGVTTMIRGMRTKSKYPEEGFL